MEYKILEEINIKDYNITTAIRKVKKNESFPIHYKKTTRVKCITNTLPFILQVEDKNYLINEKDFLLLKDENNNIIISTYNNDEIESDFLNQFQGPIYNTIKKADIKFQTKRIYLKAIKFSLGKYKLIEFEGLDNIPDFNEIFNDEEIKFTYKKIIYTSILSYIKYKTIECPDINSHIEYLNNSTVLYKQTKKLINNFKKNKIRDNKKKLALLQNNNNENIENIDVI